MVVWLRFKKEYRSHSTERFKRACGNAECSRANRGMLNKFFPRASSFNGFYDFIQLVRTRNNRAAALLKLIYHWKSNIP